MIHFEKPPTWADLTPLLWLDTAKAAGVGVQPITASFSATHAVKAVQLRVGRSWMSGRDYYLKRAVYVKAEIVPGLGRRYTFDEEAYKEKLDELLPIAAESNKYAKERAEARDITKARENAAITRINAASPTGAVHRTEGEWLLSEKPVYSKRFRVTDIAFDSSGVPEFTLEIRHLTEEQLVKLLHAEFPQPNPLKKEVP